MRDIKNPYYYKEEFVKHSATIILGRFAFDKSPVSFNEIAWYLKLTPSSLRKKKSDAEVMEILRDLGIEVEKIKGKNYFFVSTVEDNVN